MHPPLVTEAVAEHTLSIEASITLLTPIITEVAIEEEDIDKLEGIVRTILKLEGIVRTILRNHNASYVENLVIQIRPVITDLLSPIKVLRTVEILLP